MIVFEPLASPGAANGQLRFDGFARSAARGAFGFLGFTGRASAQTPGRAAGTLGFEGQAFRAVTGGRGAGFLGFEGQARARVAGSALGWLVFDRAAFTPEHVPTGRGDLEFDLSGSGGYRRTQANSPLGFLGFDGRARSASLGATARGELRFEGAQPLRIDPDAVNAFLVAGSSISAELGVDRDWLNDAVVLGQDTRIDVSTLLVQRLRATDAARSSAEASSELADGVDFAEAVTLTYRLLVAEGFVAGDTAASLYSAIARTQDGLLLTGVVDTEAEAASLVASAVLLGLRIDAVLRESFTDGLHLGDSIASDIEQVVALIDGLRVGDATSNYAILSAVVAESFKVSDSVTTSAEAAALLREALRFGIRIGIDSGEYTAWVLNTESKHLSSYAQFPINSFAEIRGRLYGACDDGIYALDGDDDAGQPIAARMRFALTTLGTGVQKRVESAYLGYTADNELLLQVIHTDDAGGKRAYTYRMDAAPAAAPVNGRVKFGRGVKSAYYAFQLSNVDGGMFDIDKMAVYPLALDRRITRN